MSRSLLLLAGLALPALAAAQSSNVGPDGAPPLYGCVIDTNQQRFSGLPLDGCVRAAPLSADWHWLGLVARGTEANYVDLRHPVRRDDAIGLWMLSLRPDSSGAVLGGPETFAQFDIKVHVFIDCAARRTWSEQAQLLRNGRTAPQVVKDVVRSEAAPKPIADGSVTAQVEALACDGGHPRATLP